MGCHYLMLFTIELFVITVISCLFMAMINNSILTAATRYASCDRGAPNHQGRSSGERSRNNEEVVQPFTRKYYHIKAFTRKYYHRPGVYTKLLSYKGICNNGMSLFDVIYNWTVCNHCDFLFMAMINNSILTSATRSANCDRGAPNPQGRSYGERSRNNEEVVQAFTRIIK